LQLAATITKSQLRGAQLSAIQKIKGMAAIKDNMWDGVGVGGKNNTATIKENAAISGNKANGVAVFLKSEDCVLEIKYSAAIMDNELAGVDLLGTRNTMIMLGGSIGGNAAWGLSKKGKYCIFEKQTGAVIYGKAPGVNANTMGAIIVSNTLSCSDGAATGTVYAAETDGNGDNIALKQKPAVW
jgi:hypothetical protein